MNVSLMWNSVGFYQVSLGERNSFCSFFLEKILEIAICLIFSFYPQIAKLSMIPVSCFLEVVLDKVRYSRDTKLSIILVLLGVAVCTVTDVSVNAKGFIAALVAVWSSVLQQYVSNTLLNP